MKKVTLPKIEKEIEEVRKNKDGSVEFPLTAKELEEFLDKKPDNLKDWLEENIQWPLERFWRNIIDFPKEVKWYFQRANRGWADSDAWSGYIYLAQVNLGIIKELIKQDYSYPMSLKNKKEWNKVLKEMAYPFELTLKEEEVYDFKPRTQRNQKKFIKGLNLYKKYFGDLWS